MNKIIEFLKQSNRYKHLIGGLLVGILAFTPWTALYAAAVVAENVEFAESKNAAGGNADFGGAPSAPSPSGAAGDGFMNIPDGIDEELPFN